MERLVWDELLTVDGAGKAVVANGEILARRLGYLGGTKDTPVKCVTIFKNGAGVEIEIGDGTYASATFAHVCCQIEGLESGKDPNTRSASIDANALSFMRQYMGERIMAEAEDPSGSRHRFVREMLKAEGGVLLISFAPRKRNKPH